MPPRKTAATTPQPSASAARNPGGKFSIRSTTPAGRAGAARRSARGRVLEAERTGAGSPSISAPNWTNSRAISSGRDRPGRRRGRRAGTAAMRAAATAPRCERARRARRRSRRAPAGTPARSRPQPVRRITARSSMPRGVPTTTSVSPGFRSWSGSGAGIGSSPRTTATIETPVLVRAPVVADGPARNGDPSPIGSSRSPGPRPVGADGPGPRRRARCRAAPPACAHPPRRARPNRSRNPGRSGRRPSGRSARPGVGARRAGPRPSSRTRSAPPAREAASRSPSTSRHLRSHCRFAAHRAARRS